MIREALNDNRETRRTNDVMEDSASHWEQTQEHVVYVLRVMILQQVSVFRKRSSRILNTNTSRYVIIINETSPSRNSLPPSAEIFHNKNDKSSSYPVPYLLPIPSTLCTTSWYLIVSNNYTIERPFRGLTMTEILMIYERKWRSAAEMKSVDPSSWNC